MINPLATFIHLTRDPQQRRKDLVDMADHKLTSGRNFIMAQRRSLDVLRPHWTEHSQEDSGGDFFCTRFDCTQFACAESVRSVFDALVFYLLNMEISISEKLGHITLREDYDTLGSSISHHRLVSHNDNGVAQEISRVMFARFVERGDEGTYGIVAVDFVDVDDLYPFSPSQHIRKDITAAVLVSGHRREREGRREGEPQEELVVVFQRAAFMRLHKPQMDISAPSLRQVQENIAQWGDVMLKVIRDRVCPTTECPIRKP